MYHENIVLTDVDRAILNSYRDVLYGLADYLGKGYELVLHSLESMEHSIIAIVNGFHTHRKEGSPITDLALRMLAQIESGSCNGYISYHAKNKNGMPLKSTTIAIRGQYNRIIGLLCINFYLNTPLSTLLTSLTGEETSSFAALTENFVDNTNDLVAQILSKVIQEVNEDDSVLPSFKNKEIVSRCYAQGVFQFKGAVPLVAKGLGISKNTVYLHLRNIPKPGI